MPLYTNTLAILTIENDCIRIVDDNLDNCLEPINNYPTLDLSKYPKDLFDEYDYFWDRLHDGDDDNSQNYADVYMAYLFYHLKMNVANILYQNYLKTLQGELGLICYWQKQWLKYVFKVEFAKELREFDKQEWVEIINSHLKKYDKN